MLSPAYSCRFSPGGVCAEAWGANATAASQRADRKYRTSFEDRVFINVDACLSAQSEPGAPRGALADETSQHLVEAVTVIDRNY
jgi:hypothetical protein